MPPMRCNPLFTVIVPCLVLYQTLYGVYDDGIKKQFLYLPCHTDDHLAFRVISYIMYPMSESQHSD